MRRDIFQRGITRLSTFFARKLNNDQLDIWYGCLKHMPDGVFGRALEHIIRNKKAFPVPNDFTEYWNDFMPKQREAQVDNRTQEQKDRDCARLRQVAGDWLKSRDVSKLKDEDLEDKEEKQKDKLRQQTRQT